MLEQKNSTLKVIMFQELPLEEGTVRNQDDTVLPLSAVENRSNGNNMLGLNCYRVLGSLTLFGR